MIGKSFTLRIDGTAFDKLRVVADYEARSVNGQINVLIRERIEKYKEKNGKIVIKKRGEE